MLEGKQFLCLLEKIHALRESNQSESFSYDKISTSMSIIVSTNKYTLVQSMFRRLLKMI